MMAHWWWCALALLSFVYRTYGYHAVVWSLRHAAHPGYVYTGRHHLGCAGDDTLDATWLIEELRAERAAARTPVERLHEEFYGNHYVSPLTDRAPDFFPAVSRPEWCVMTPPPYAAAEVIEGELEMPPVDKPSRGLTTLQQRIVERMNA